MLDVRQQLWSIYKRDLDRIRKIMEKHERDAIKLRIRLRNRGEVLQECNDDCIATFRALVKARERAADLSVRLAVEMRRADKLERELNELRQDSDRRSCHCAHCGDGD